MISRLNMPNDHTHYRDERTQICVRFDTSRPCTVGLDNTDGQGWRTVRYRLAPCLYRALRGTPGYYQASLTPAGRLEHGTLLLTPISTGARDADI